ncbi:MAG: TIGR00300 family protein [Candidatus Altiarchaeales archaeon WOR_SM1_86-2]|nr:MAG: TIGR00300 family protein [Candidatus Altiarchaeales archaeon WOR_SM1_86-2]
MKETIELTGHIIDSGIFQRVLDTIMDMRGDFEIIRLDVGKRKTEESYAQLIVEGSREMFDELERLGATLPTAEAETKKAPENGVLPDNFYGTTHHPTFIYLNGKWREVDSLEMDCIVVVDRERKRAVCKRQGLVEKGEDVVVGLKGIKVSAPQRSREPMDIFGFMSSGVSPEKPVNEYIINLAEEMKRVKDAGGFIIHVVGTAMAHTGADRALAELIRMGYMQAMFTGNGFATMDIEKQFFGTTLGMDEKTGRVLKRGYKSHLVAINEISKAGGLKEAVGKGVLKGGVMYECIKHGVPFVIGGSLRDDGPLPDTITDVMEAQDEMRKYVQNADMCIIYASMLHGIATGNMLPSRVKTVAIDINPYVVTRLQDRGTTHALGIVSDPCVLLPRLVEELKKLE